MSKLAKKPIVIKEGVSISLENRRAKITGPKGSLSFFIPNCVSVKVVDNLLVVSAEKVNDDKTRIMLGLTHSILANMVDGVSLGFSKQLELSGVGYRALLSGNVLILSVGFSNPVKINAPDGITFSVADNVITISGIDKDLVGNVAAKVRAIRPPEPYKGKGIRYVGEKIRRKAGKAAKVLGTK